MDDAASVVTFLGGVSDVATFVTFCGGAFYFISTLTDSCFFASTFYNFFTFFGL